jgi:hypothetical protein
MDVNGGSAVGNAGGSDARASVCSNAGWTAPMSLAGADGMHRWVGFGVIADNLMNIATLTRARAGA